MKGITSALKLIECRIECTFNEGKEQYQLKLTYKDRVTGSIYYASQIVSSMERGIEVAEIYRKILK